MSERGSTIDLDAPGGTGSVGDNAVWASRLFTADKTAAPGPAAVDGEPRAPAGVDAEQKVAHGAGGAEPHGAHRVAPAAIPDRGNAATHPAPPVPLDLSAVSAVAALAAAGAGVGEDEEPSAAATPGRGWAMALGILTAVFAVAATSILLVWGRTSAPPPKQHVVPTLPVGAPTAAPQAGPVGGDEIIIPYTATPGGCYAGSTSPKALQETATDSAWVCVRGFGGSGGGSDGQTLTVQLGDPTTGPGLYKVCEIETTPGWIPKKAGGRDEWNMHRVPTLIRYVFNDSTDPRREPTVWDVDTRNAHGPVPYRGSGCVLASAITMVILATSPAPKDVSSASTTSSSPELPGPEPAPQSATPAPPDPSDATFAVSLLQVKGFVP